MRKVLSFVLVLSLVLGSFSMAFAAPSVPTDVAGSPNAEAITVNVNLGIVEGFPDGTFKPAEAVNRAQFAKMIVEALGIPESALAGYTKVSFKDMSGYGWATPYIAFCESKGIMLGDGNGNAMPGRGINSNEAVTMLLRAVGYTSNSAQLIGVWPSNYVSLGQREGLYKKVANAINVDRQNAAQMIANTLTVPFVSVAADGKTDVFKGNMLTSGHDAVEVKGIINGGEESLINLKPYIGKSVTYYRQKDKPYAIIAIASEDSSGVTGKFKTSDVTLTSTTDGSFTFVAPKLVENNTDVEYTLKGSVETLFLNGEEITATTTISSKQAITVNGDVSGKSISNLSSFAYWSHVGSNGGDKKVSKSDIKQIDDARLLGFDFVTLKNDKIDENSFALVGVSALDKIAEDNIVYVYVNKSGEITRVEVGTEVVKGDVTSVKSSGTKFTISGKTYELADKTDGSDIPNAGDTVILYLDADGKIYSIDITSGATKNYGVYLGYDVLYDKVKLYDSEEDDAVWYEYDTKNIAKSTVQNTLVAFGIDAKGKIDVATRGSFNAMSTGTTVLTGLVLKDNTGTYRVSADAAVFASTSTGAAVDTNIDFATTIDNVDTSKDLGQIYYMRDKDGIVVAMIVKEANASKTSKDSYAVVTDWNSVKNADGDTVQQLLGYIDGAKLDKLTKGKNTFATANDLAVPGLYKLALDSNGVIKTATAANGALEDGISMVTGTVAAVKSNGTQLDIAGTWYYVAKDAIVYQAVMKNGEVDSYRVADTGSLYTKYTVFLYNTIKDEDSSGFDTVIFVTDK